MTKQSLRERRLKLGKTLREMQKHTGLDSSTISRMEREMNDPKKSNYDRYDAALSELERELVGARVSASTDGEAA